MLARPIARQVTPALALALALAPVAASAHIALMSPPPRHTQQKTGPCGVADDQRGDTITTFMPGETITLVWQETIDHPSHYRIAFDADGFDDFVDPKTADELYSNAAVLLDGIPDMKGGMYMAEVTLPDVECDTCTLQLIQVMKDKPPFGDGNDMYYQCADVVLMGMGASSTSDGTTGSTGTTGDETTGDETTGGGTNSGGSSSEGSSSGGSSSGGSSSGGATTGGTGTTGSDAGSGDSSAGGDGGASGGDSGEAGCGCTLGQDSGPVGGAALVALLVLVGRRRRSR